MAVRCVGFMKISGIAAALSLSVLVGCGALDLRDDEVIVRERAQARWDALVKADIPTAYGYLSPASRAMTSLEAYATSIRAGFWKSAKVNSVTCNTKDSCEVHVAIEYAYQGRRTKTSLTETWIQEDSKWWYLQR